MRPISDNIFVKRHKNEISKGGIILPNRVDTNTGRVFLVGHGKRLDNGEFEPTVVKPGDVVAYNRKFALHQVELDGVEYDVVSEYYVYAVIGEDE